MKTALLSCLIAAAVSAFAVHPTPVLHAVDALGRETPLCGRGASAPRTDKERLVGLFYFLWCGEHGRNPPRDVSKILAANPKAGYFPNDPAWGGIGFYHHWGEPFYGYYYSDDEWVVRHHLKLIMQADVDFLFFDTTNAVIYERNAKLVMRVLQEYHDQGWKIPQVMFYTNTRSGATVQAIYDHIYRPRFAPDTWFKLDGKPVIVAIEKECSAKTKAFFTIVKSQWPNEADKIGGWPWMDFTRPQRVFPGETVKRSVMNVSVAQHPQIRFGDSAMYGEKANRGRAFHHGANDPAPDAWKRGGNFAEQFEHAIAKDPDIVLVTGWNEWIAGRWPGTKTRPILFVDCANYEYSRDIEMMRGGYFDNFFMQLVDYVRRYKGVAQVPVNPRSTATERKPVTYPYFRDGGFARNAPGYGTNYVNRTQRNVPTEIQVHHTADELVFNITTLNPIVEVTVGSRVPRDRNPSERARGTRAPTGGEPLSVYLNLDGKAGYQFAIRRGADGLVRLLKAKTRGEKLDFDATGPVLKTTLDGNHYTVRVPLAALGIASGNSFSVSFKIADATQPYREVADFYDLGCAAPLGRLNFIYRGR